MNLPLRIVTIKSGIMSIIKRQRHYLVDREIIQTIGLGSRGRDHIVGKVADTARRFTLTEWGARRLAGQRIDHLCQTDALSLNHRHNQYQVNAFNSFGAGILGIPVLEVTPQSLDRLKDSSCGLSTTLAIALTFPSAYGNPSVQ